MHCRYAICRLPNATACPGQLNHQTSREYLPFLPPRQLPHHSISRTRTGCRSGTDIRRLGSRHGAVMDEFATSGPERHGPPQSFPLQLPFPPLTRAPGQVYPDSLVYTGTAFAAFLLNNCPSEQVTSHTVRMRRTWLLSLPRNVHTFSIHVIEPSSTRFPHSLLGQDLIPSLCQAFPTPIPFFHPCIALRVCQGLAPFTRVNHGPLFPPHPRRRRGGRCPRLRHPVWPIRRL